MKDAIKVYLSSLTQILLVSVQTINLQHGRLALVGITSMLIGITGFIMSTVLPRAVGLPRLLTSLVELQALP